MQTQSSEMWKINKLGAKQNDYGFFNEKQAHLTANFLRLAAIVNHRLTIFSIKAVVSMIKVFNTHRFINCSNSFGLRCILCAINNPRRNEWPTVKEGASLHQYSHSKTSA